VQEEEQKRFVITANLFLLDIPFPPEEPPKNIPFLTSPGYKNGIYKQNKQQGHPSQTAIVYDKRFYIFSFPTGISSIHLINTVRLSILTVIQLLLLSKPNLCY
ncbi:MAG TPA: hypothetical protein DHW74_02330, partial [Bacteroides stercoris]|nr:hypothetical protein [Bacteroides stercoris]